MTLTSLIDVDFPEIKLVKVNQFDNLPQINPPNKKISLRHKSV